MARTRQELAAVATVEIDEREVAGSVDSGALASCAAAGATLSEERNSPLVSLAIRRAHASDLDALAFLYTRYSDDIHGYVRSIVRDHHEVEDITQHVFAKLMRVIGKYHERDIAFLAWTLRLAHNAVMDRIRSERLLPVEEIHAADDERSDPASSCGRAQTTVDGSRTHALLGRS